MGGDGEDWESPSVAEWYLAIKEGATNHVLVAPFDLYEMLMEVNREQKQGRLKIGISAAGMEESYATLDVMAKTIEGVVGKMSKDQVLPIEENNKEVGVISKSDLRIHEGESVGTWKD